MRFVLKRKGLRNPILLVFSQFKKGNGNRSEGMFLIGFVFCFLDFRQSCCSNLHCQRTRHRITFPLSDKLFLPEPLLFIPGFPLQFHKELHIFHIGRIGGHVGIALLYQKGIQKRTVFQIDIGQGSLVAVISPHIIFQADSSACKQCLDKVRSLLAKIFNLSPCGISDFGGIYSDQPNFLFLAPGIDYPKGVAVHHFGYLQKVCSLLAEGRKHKKNGYKK